MNTVLILAKQLPVICAGTPATCGGKGSSHVEQGRASRLFIRLEAHPGRGRVSGAAASAGGTTSAAAGLPAILRAGRAVPRGLSRALLGLQGLTSTQKPSLQLARVPKLQQGGRCSYLVSSALLKCTSNNAYPPLALPHPARLRRFSATPASLQLVQGARGAACGL